MSATPAAVTSGWMGALSDLGTLGSDAYGIYNAASQQGQAGTVFQQSNPFGAYRPTYGNMLLNLIQNPSSVTSQPGYKFLMDQGIQAIDRSAAASGGVGLGSGAELTALDQFGQGTADQFYNQQVATLAKLAGADINPANPAQALTAEQNASSGVGASINQALSGISTAHSLYSDLSGLFAGPSTAGGVAATYASGALADSAVTGALGSTVASELGATSGSIAASNSAALASQIAAEGEAGSAAGGSAASGSSAAIGGSAAADIAIPVAAFAAMYLGGNALNSALDGPNNNWGIAQINDLIKAAQGGVNSGALSTSTKAGSFNPMNPNGTVNPQAMQAITALTQLQDGSFGQADPYVQSQLNNMGFRTIAQQVSANGGWKGSGGGGGSMRGSQRF